ncbi:hypothetical protein Efla_003988 [Eimeria flavescens]
MTTLLRAFRGCLERLRYQKLTPTATLPGEASSEGLHEGNQMPISAAKVAEADMTMIDSHASNLSRENPSALAHLVAYFREVQRVNDLLHQHGVGAPSKPLKDLQKTAELVGLRLPVQPGQEPSQQAQGGASSKRPPGGRSLLLSNRPLRLETTRQLVQNYRRPL